MVYLYENLWGVYNGWGLVCIGSYWSLARGGELSGSVDSMLTQTLVGAWDKMNCFITEQIHLHISWFNESV